MNGLIYKEDAIKAAIEAADEWDGWFDIQRENTITDAINALTSVNPERKKGRWIAHGDIPKTCSCCHEDWDKYVYGYEIWHYDELPNYCPNCGANMKGKKNE